MGCLSVTQPLNRMRQVLTRNNGQDILSSGAEQQHHMPSFVLNISWYIYLKACNSRNNLVSLVSSERRTGWGSEMGEKPNFSVSWSLR